MTDQLNLKNRRLIELLSAVQQTEDEAVHNEIYREIIMRAEFLCPFRIDKTPEAHGEGVMLLPEGASIYFPSISSEGKQYYYGFTSREEMDRLHPGFDGDTTQLDFKRFFDMTLQEESVDGFVIDPGSIGYIIPRSWMVRFCELLEEELEPIERQAHEHHDHDGCDHGHEHHHGHDCGCHEH